MPFVSVDVAINSTNFQQMGVHMGSDYSSQLRLMLGALLAALSSSGSDLIARSSGRKRRVDFISLPLRLRLCCYSRRQRARGWRRWRGNCRKRSGRSKWCSHPIGSSNSLRMSLVHGPCRACGGPWWCYRRGQSSSRSQCWGLPGPALVNARSVRRMPLTFDWRLDSYYSNLA